MLPTISIGIQDFDQLRRNNYFYIDKTSFLTEWWESGDIVTLITRPRRFGKTLNLNMAERFFSLAYAGQSDIFESLNVWQNPAMRLLQGTYPVISLSFAAVKERTLEDTVYRICSLLSATVRKYPELLSAPELSGPEKNFLSQWMNKVERRDAAQVLVTLSECLCKVYRKKVLIFLDEYDTPMQEAFFSGFWQGLTDFTRNLFNAAFKTNPAMERALLTGITRVSRESMFSDLNNLKVITTTSDQYAESFGFTEEEVRCAMSERGMGDFGKIREWYDGFQFGRRKDIYNPWSIINYLDTGKIDLYWANTSSNRLISRLIREGSGRLKEKMEQLMKGETIRVPLDEQVVYSELETSPEAVWSLFLASGYVKAVNWEQEEEAGENTLPVYELQITNREVRRMFARQIASWFEPVSAEYNEFVKSFLAADIPGMNQFMNRIALSSFSSFDTGNHPSGAEPERFYHGFVLGLLVELNDRYLLLSNRESGYGRYDVVLQPRNTTGDAFVLEFKVRDPEKEEDLKSCVAAALKQIREKQYDRTLRDSGISEDRIHHLGFAFEGKKVLVGTED